MSDGLRATPAPLWSQHLVAIRGGQHEVDYSAKHSVLVSTADGLPVVASSGDKPPKTVSKTFVQREATDTD